MQKRIVPALILAAPAALLSLVAMAPSAVRAQSATCQLGGSPVMTKTAMVWNAQSAGEAIAKFTGQPIPLTATLTSASRAKTKTGTGTGGFRIEGFVEVQDLPAFTTRNVPVAAGHVWIGGGRRVRISPQSSGQVTIELTATAPIDQTLRATAQCDAISLDLPTFHHPSPPGSARGWLAKKSPLEVRGDPGGQSVFTFTSSSVKDALLFWSTERSAGQVHVQLTGDVVVDGWMAASDLEALKVGEMLDATAPSTTTISQPKLMMQGSPNVGKATKDASIHQRPQDTSPLIGAIEAGGEVLILETVLGWSNVIPTSLAITPADGGNGFWVKTADLAITPSPPSK